MSEEEQHLPVVTCHKDAFGAYYSCIAHDREQCPRDTKKLCRDRSFIEKHRCKYSILITPPSWDGYKYSLFYDKHYGNSSGGATEFKTKRELLLFIQALFLEWQSYDGIVSRVGDPVTPKTLYFRSFTNDITKMELFGFSKLDAFFG